MNYQMIVKISFLLVLFLTQCKYFEGENEGFGKKWMDGPNEELLEGKIYYVRNNVDTNSEYLFERLNLDPRAIARIAVVSYAKKLEKMFIEKDYEAFYWEIIPYIEELVALKYGIAEQSYDENGEPEKPELTDEQQEQVKEFFINSLKRGEGICAATDFFTKPILKIEIRAYQAFTGTKDNNFRMTYRIDYIHNLDPNLDVESDERGRGVTIQLTHYFDEKPRSFYTLTRIVNHCPIPELQDRVEE